MLRNRCYEVVRRIAAAPAFALNGSFLQCIDTTQYSYGIARDVSTSWASCGSQSPQGLFPLAGAKHFSSDGSGRSEGAAGRGRTRAGRSNGDFIQETLDYHDPASTAGQTTWNLVWDGEDHGEEGEEEDEVWECDFTGGAIPNNEINGLLSNRAKWEMYNLHKDNPQEYDVPFLANKYRIREQRVMAIIALKEMEEQAIEAGQFTRAEADAKHDELDRTSGAEYGEGVGERAYPQIATFPKFEYVTPEEISADENADKDAVEVLRAKLARKHEAQAVAEFQERLDFNMKRVGKTLDRRRRKKSEVHAGTGKTKILIKPLGRSTEVEPWVAVPGEGTRSLNEDEELLLKRMKPKPRRRTMW